MKEKKKKKKRYEKEYSFSLHSLMDDLGEKLHEMGNAISGEGGGEAPDAEDYEFIKELAGAEEAEIRVNINRAQCAIRSLEPDSENLLEAQLRALGEVECTVTGDEHKLVRLGTPSGSDNFFRWPEWKRNAKLPWDIALTPRIPLHLRVNSGVGTNTLLLQELNLRELRLNGGAGKTTMLLPATGQAYRARVRCGAGEQVISITDGAQCRLDAEVGAGRFQLSVGENCELKGSIRGGAGACEIELPPGVAVRLQVTSGIGRVRLPEHFQKLSGHSVGFSSDAVWYSGYDPYDEEQAAAIRLSIHVGAGSLRIRQLEFV